MNDETRHKGPRRKTKAKNAGVGLEIRRARARLRLLAVLGLLGFVGLGARLTDLAVLSPGAPAAAPGDVAVHALKLITDPTGGRLLRAGSAGGLERAFAQINAELRHQYVLTYYTDSPPTPGAPPRVELDVPGHKGLKAKVVFGADQIY